MNTRLQTIHWQPDNAFTDEMLTADDFRELAEHAREHAHDLEEYNFDDDDTVIEDDDYCFDDWTLTAATLGSTSKFGPPSDA